MIKEPWESGPPPWIFAEEKEREKKQNSWEAGPPDWMLEEEKEQQAAIEKRGEEAVKAMEQYIEKYGEDDREIDDDYFDLQQYEREEGDDREKAYEELAKKEEQDLIDALYAPFYDIEDLSDPSDYLLGEKDLF